MVKLSFEIADQNSEIVEKNTNCRSKVLVQLQLLVYDVPRSQSLAPDLQATTKPRYA